MKMIRYLPKFIKYYQFFLSALIFIFVLLIFFHTDSAITQDLGRHFKLGEIILNQKKIPTTNFFSYTYPSFPFVNHHWGSEVIFFLINKHLGINGLIILKVVISLITFSLIFFFSHSRAKSFYLLFVSVLSLEMIRERTEIRPEIFSYLFFSIFLTVLYKERERSTKVIFFLPILLIFWVNLHISYILGIAVYLLFILDRLVLKQMELKYIILGFLIVISVLLNPYGIKGAIYPFQIFNNYGYTVVENQTPFFLDKLIKTPTIFYFKIALLLTFIAIPVLTIRKYYFQMLTVLLTLLMSLSAIRHFPFFAYSLIFPLSITLQIIGNKIRKLFFRYFSSFKQRRFIALSVLGLFLLIEIYSLLSNGYYYKRNSPLRTGFGVVKGMNDVVDYFISKKLQGPIFNNFDIGSYLIYRLYPKEFVFVDGRPEAYPKTFFQDIYIPMQRKYDVWKETSSKYQFETIIFAHTDATPWGREFLSRIINNDKDWELVYFDDYGVIFVRRKNLSFGNKLFETDEELISEGFIRISRARENDELMRLANFYNLLGFFDLSDIARVKAEGLQ